MIDPVCEDGERQAVLGQIAAYKAKIALYSQLDLVRRRYERLRNRYLPDNRQRFSHLIALVCQELELNEVDVFGENRTEEIVAGRHLLMHLMWDTGIISQSSIARLFNCRASTVSHALVAFQDRYQTQSVFHAQVDRLQDALKFLAQPPAQVVESTTTDHDT
jgi:chromosomal replication initiation ATPase DnaA